MAVIGDKPQSVARGQIWRSPFAEDFYVVGIEKTKDGDKAMLVPVQTVKLAALMASYTYVQES